MADCQDYEAKLHLFLKWLQINGVDLRCCTIKSCGSNQGFGLFTSSIPSENGVAMAIPLDLSINPMRVLQDPSIGHRCRALLDEGDVDDRFLMILFLTVERLRPNSMWKPYLDMLPTSFGSPMWFTEDEFTELKGTTLHRASVLQRKNLQALYDDKVEALVTELLDDIELLESVDNCGLGGMTSKRPVQFEDFLWAYSIFWTRALNIPFPRSYVFPESIEDQSINHTCHNGHCGLSETEMNSNILLDKESSAETSSSKEEETVWVEGLVPGIDFCNHGLNPSAAWDVDQTGTMTGIPTSMYLRFAIPDNMKIDEEIRISYGNKGNEELLYLYGFTIDNNPSDFLMVHYPLELLQNDPLSENKEKLLELQKAELRCLLPKNLLGDGYFTGSRTKDAIPINSFSWSGQRKVPSYLHNLVFPQEFMAALRTISMRDNEIKMTFSLLEELKLAGSIQERQPSEVDVRAAVWETCGDYAALELLVDLLRAKIVELEESSGTFERDSKLLEDFHISELDDQKRENKRSSIVYRKGQKQLTRSFLLEAEHTLELCAAEQVLRMETSP